MVRIRFRRVGGRHQPSYRIVAADKRSPRDGRFLETLGHYNPRTEPATVKVDEKRLFHWLKNGAQPSEAVSKVLRSIGTWERWERFKSGEELESLLEEAAAARVEVDPRTRRDDLIGKRPAKAEAREAEAPAAEESRRESGREAQEPGELQGKVAQEQMTGEAAKPEEAEGHPDAQTAAGEESAEERLESPEEPEAVAQAEAQSEAEAEIQEEAAGGDRAKEPGAEENEGPPGEEDASV